MELLPLAPESWDRVARVLADLTAGVGLVIGAAFTAVLARMAPLLFPIPVRAHGGAEVVVSVPDSTPNGDSHGNGVGATRARRVLYPLAVLSGLAALFAFGRAIVLAVELASDIFPRLLI